MRKYIAGLIAGALLVVPITAVAGVDGQYLTLNVSQQTNDEAFYEENCWEDEVVVRVVHDPYGLALTVLACVPGDNIPWDPDGFRP